MSLIQEALKRQQMEQAGKVPTPPPADIPKTTPYAPPPLEETDVNEVSRDEAPRPKPSLRIRDESVTTMPEDQKEGNSPGQPAFEEPTVNANPDSVRISPSSNPGNEKPQRIWPALLTTLLVLTLLLGAVIWAVIIGLDWAGIKTPWQSEPVSESTELPAIQESPTVTSADIPAPISPATDAKPFMVATEPVSPKETTAPSGPLVTQAVPPIKEGVSQQTESKPFERSLVDSEVKAVGATPPSVTEERTPPIAKPIAESETTVPETIEPQEVPHVDATAPAPRTWPDLIISGVVGNNHKGAAFINGKVVGVNESILKVKVLGIQSQSVLLEYEGETRLIKVGQPVNRR